MGAILGPTSLPLDQVLRSHDPKQPTRAVKHRNAVDAIGEQQLRDVFRQCFRFNGDRIDLLYLVMDERTQAFCTDRFFFQERDNCVAVRVLIGHGVDFA